MKALFKWRRKPKVAQAAGAVVGNAAAGVTVDTASVVVNPAAVVRRQYGHEAGVGGIGMQGYAPIVTISKNRHGTKCKCGEVVLRGVRHICIHNAEYHLDTLTMAERWRLIHTLRGMGVKE